MIFKNFSQKRHPLMLSLLCLIFVSTFAQEEIKATVYKNLDIQYIANLKSNIGILQGYDERVEKKLQTIAVQQDEYRYQFLDAKRSTIKSLIQDLNGKIENVQNLPSDLDDYYKLLEHQNRSIDISEITEDEELNKVLGITQGKVVDSGDENSEQRKEQDNQEELRIEEEKERQRMEEETKKEREEFQREEKRKAEEEERLRIERENEEAAQKEAEQAHQENLGETESGENTQAPLNSSTLISSLLQNNSQAQPSSGSFHNPSLMEVLTNIEEIEEKAPILTSTDDGHQTFAQGPVKALAYDKYHLNPLAQTVFQNPDLEKHHENEILKIQEESQKAQQKLLTEYEQRRQKLQEQRTKLEMEEKHLSQQKSELNNTDKLGLFQKYGQVIESNNLFVHGEAAEKHVLVHNGGDRKNENAEQELKLYLNSLQTEKVKAPKIGKIIAAAAPSMKLEQEVALSPEEKHFLDLLQKRQQESLEKVQTQSQKEKDLNKSLAKDQEQIDDLDKNMVKDYEKTQEELNQVHDSEVNEIVKLLHKNLQKEKVFKSKYDQERAQEIQLFNSPLGDADLYDALSIKSTGQYYQLLNALDLTSSDKDAETFAPIQTNLQKALEASKRKLSEEDNKFVKQLIGFMKKIRENDIHLDFDISKGSMELKMLPNDSATKNQPENQSETFEEKIVVQQNQGQVQSEDQQTQTQEQDQSDQLETQTQEQDQSDQLQTQTQEQDKLDDKLIQSEDNQDQSDEHQIQSQDKQDQKQQQSPLTENSQVDNKLSQGQVVTMEMMGEQGSQNETQENDMKQQEVPKDNQASLQQKADNPNAIQNQIPQQIHDFSVEMGKPKEFIMNEKGFQKHIMIQEGKIIGDEDEADGKFEIKSEQLIDGNKTKGLIYESEVFVHTGVKDESSDSSSSESESNDEAENEEESESEESGDEEQQQQKVLKRKLQEEYFKISQKLKERIKTKIFQLPECQSNKQVQKEADYILTLLQKNLLQFQKKENYQLAQKIENLKKMIFKGRIIQEEQVNNYLQEIRNFVDQTLMETMKKETFDEEKNNLVFSVNVLNQLNQYIVKEDIGNGVLGKDIKNLATNLQKKLQTLVTDEQNSSQLSEQEKQLIRKRISDQINKDISGLDPKEGEKAIKIVSDNVDAILKSEIDENYAGENYESKINQALKDYLSKVDDLKQRNAKGTLVNTIKLDDFMDDLVKQLQQESKVEFGRKVQSFHGLLQQLNKDLEENNIPKVERSNLMNSVYTQINDAYLKSLKKIKEMTKDQNSYTLEDIAQSGDNELIDSSFKDIKVKIDQQKLNLQNSLKIDELKDLIFDMISRSEKNEPPQRLLSQMGYDFRKQYRQLNEQDKSQHHLATHFLSIWKKEGLENAMRKLSDAINILEQNKGSTQRVLLIQQGL